MSEWMIFTEWKNEGEKKKAASVTEGKNPTET